MNQYDERFSHRWARCIIYQVVYASCTFCTAKAKKWAMIYVLRTRSAPFLKIGFTDNSISDRIKSIQTGCPFSLDLIHVEQGDLASEKEIHKRLARHKVNGEWFELCEKTLGIFGLNDQSPALDPLTIDTIPSRRQMQLNAKFSLYRNPKAEDIISLTDFSVKYGCTEEDMIRIAPRYAKYIIVMTTGKDIKERFQRITDDDPEKKQLFMIAKWRTEFLGT